MAFTETLNNLEIFIRDQLECYFNAGSPAPRPDGFQIESKNDNAFTEFIAEHQLNCEEQLLLYIALVPHLNPEFYTNVIQHYLPDGGDLPIFGGAKCKNHRGILPTGETTLFIIAGTNIEQRIQLAERIRKSILLKKGILQLGTVPNVEPAMSGTLSVSKEYVDLFLNDEITVPSFGPDFPAQKIETEREWDDLVLTDDVKEQIEELKIWMQHNDRLMQDWQMHKKLKPGYRVLFHGPSGTGKTLTATLLGKYTKRTVFRVDLSTIVSKYIGETEKNLERLFSKAAHKDWILFFDEADALFGKRTQVNDSHDRYANQEVSYLLQRVENFGGLTILSTNYKSNIDEAFLRRFNAVIKFPFPDAKQRKQIWKKSLPVGIPLAEDVNLSDIAVRYKLSGGSIINAVHNACLHELQDNSDRIMTKNILYGIKREIEKEGKVFNPIPERPLMTNGTQ